jgi:amidohydrolase
MNTVLPLYELNQVVSKHVRESFEQVVAWRRHLHRNPELSFQEKQTSEFVCAKLTELGVTFEKNVGGYGVVGVIEGGGGKGKLIALRADMDALPIQEENSADYCSTNPGVMHACGHDVHTANLLGVASVLQKIRSHFSGTIMLIFQPAEERLPGGASIMIKEGLFDKMQPDAIIGLHVFPQLPVGHVGMREGEYMASTDELYLTVKGKGGHGALPQDCIDPLVITAQIITAIQSITSRSSNPAIPTVLTFGKIQSKGGSTNIIPDEIYLEGTFRSMDEAWRSKAHKLLKELIEGTANAMGGSAELRIEKGYPVLKNNPELTQNVFGACEVILGTDHVHELDIRMTAEDFAYYSQIIPACFYRLGTGLADSNGKPKALHTATFDVDETCLLTGMTTMVGSVLKLLHS